MMNRPMPPAHRIDAKAIAEHQEFLSSLAQGLVGSSHLAEDAVQDAWLTVLQQPPPKQLRAYLAQVLRFRSRSRWARESGRRGAEQRAARDEHWDPSFEERFAVKEELARATLGLPEAQRRALYLRFAEDRTPAEISRLTGEPVGTIKTRLVRALKSLRRELDFRHGEDRSQWLAALVPLAPLPGVASSAGLSVCGISRLQAGLVALPLLGVALWFSLVRPMPVRLPAAAEGLAPAAGTPEVGSAAENLAMAAPVEARTDPRRPLAAKTSQSEASRLAQSGEVIARFVDQGGLPVEGITIWARSSGNHTGLALEYGACPKIEPTQTFTNAEGEMRVTVPYIPSLHWDLDATAEGFGKLARGVSAPRPGSTVDLGDFVMPIGCELTVRVLGPNGAAPTSPFRLMLRRNVDPGEYPLDDAFHSGEITNGVAIFRGLAAGNYYAVLSVEGSTFSVTADCDVGLADRNALVFRLEEEAPEPGLLVYLRRRHGGWPSAGGVRLTGPAGQRLAPSEVSEGGRVLRWKGLGEEQLTLALVDGGWLPWEQQLIGGVGVVVIEAEPTSGVRIAGLHGAKGAPLPGVSIARVSTMRSGAESLDPIHLHREDLPDDGVLRFPPGDHHLRLQGPGVMTQDLWVQGLKRDEVRDLTVSLQTKRRFVGRVLDGEGEPLAGAVVQLLRPASDGDGPSTRALLLESSPTSMPEMRKELAFAFTDPRGGFELFCEEQGRVVLRAWKEPAVTRPEGNLGYAMFGRQRPTSLHQVPELEVPAGEERSKLRLVLLSPGSVSVQLSEGEWGGFDFVLAPGDRSRGLEASLDIERLPIAHPDADGRLDFPGVGPGSYGLVALFGRQPWANTWIARKRAVLQWLELSSGQQLALSCDPDQALPAEVRMKISSIGVPPGPLSICVQPLEGTDPVAAESIHITAQAGEVLPLRVGTEGQLRVVLRDCKGAWVETHNVQLSDSGKALEIELDLVWGELQLVDGQGAPRAGAALAPFVAPGVTYFLDSRDLTRADSQGRVQLLLPRGERRFLWRSTGQPLGPIAWPPPKGCQLVLD